MKETLFSNRSGEFALGALRAAARAAASGFVSGRGVFGGWHRANLHTLVKDSSNTYVNLAFLEALLCRGASLNPIP